MKTPLFKETSFESREEEEIDPDDSVEDIMEDGLLQVAEMITTNKYLTISALKSLAQKR